MRWGALGLLVFASCGVDPVWFQPPPPEDRVLTYVFTLVGEHEVTSAAWSTGEEPPVLPLDSDDWSEAWVYGYAASLAELNLEYGPVSVPEGSVSCERTRPVRVWRQLPGGAWSEPNTNTLGFDHIMGEQSCVDIAGCERFVADAPITLPGESTANVIIGIEPETFFVGSPEGSYIVRRGAPLEPILELAGYDIYSGSRDDSGLFWLGSSKGRLLGYDPADGSVEITQLETTAPLHVVSESPGNVRGFAVSVERLEQGWLLKHFTRVHRIEWGYQEGEDIFSTNSSLSHTAMIWFEIDQGLACHGGNDLLAMRDTEPGVEGGVTQPSAIVNTPMGVFVAQPDVVLRRTVGPWETFAPTVAAQPIDSMAPFREGFVAVTAGFLRQTVNADQTCPTQSIVQDKLGRIASDGAQAMLSSANGQLRFITVRER